MKNMKNLIKQHNTKVLKNQEHSEKRSCNCRVKGNCPLDGRCVHECVVYQINVATNNECKEGFGIAEGEFKLRYNYQTMSFRHKKRVRHTELLKYLRKLKEKTLITIYSEASKCMHPHINVGQGNVTCF